MKEDKHHPDPLAAIADGSVAIEPHADVSALIGYVRWRATNLGGPDSQPTVHLTIPIIGRERAAKE